MKNILKSEGGFTLVELLGVVAIIAVLATVAITSINGAIQAGREAAASRQVQTLNSAYQSYLAAGGVATNVAATAIGALALPLPLGTGNVGPFVPNATVSMLGVKNRAGADVTIIMNDSGFALP